MVARNYKAAEPPSAPAPCRSGDRGRSAPAAGGKLRAERPAHKPNRRFGRGARTVCCANAHKDRAPEGARSPQSVTLTARILTRVRGSGQAWLAGIATRQTLWSLRGVRRVAHTVRSTATSLRIFALGLRPGQPEALPQTLPRGSAPLGTSPGPNGPEPGRASAPNRRVVASRVCTLPVRVHGTAARHPVISAGRAAAGAGIPPCREWS